MFYLTLIVSLGIAAVDDESVGGFAPVEVGVLQGTLLVTVGGSDEF